MGLGMSSNAAPWRKWYRTKRWADLKLRVHVRDNFICQKTGVLCCGKHPEPNSPVAHHADEHRGDETKFWDEANIITVTKAWHDSEAQKAEQATLEQRGVWH